MRPAARTLVAAVAAALILPWIGTTAALTSAARVGLTFAVIGDNGTGKTPQYDLARQMVKVHGETPFELVLMVGDNMYGSQTTRDFVDKFEIPYGSLLRMNIPFFAALGNHDEPDNRHYRHFNMGGQRYYAVARNEARFFFLDTNLMDAPQVKWLDAALGAATERWKVAIFHHPIYSDGDRHGSHVELRVILEPLLVRHGVDVVFSGHEHVYERTRPQQGIPYFIVGSSGQLRKGGVTPSALTAAAYAEDNVFLVATIRDDSMEFKAISRTGATIDSGMVRDRDLAER